MDEEIDLKYLVDVDNFEPTIVYCKGHVDKEEFAAKVTLYLGCQHNPVRADEVVHKYYRWGMTHYYRSDKTLMAFEYQEPGPGRFKVTVYNSY